MTIYVKGEQKLHWNYFIALEHDLEKIARYIEFSKENFKTYSIELAHILFAASSEVDVIAKLLCENINPQGTRKNINDYRPILVPVIKDLSRTKVYVDRYSLEFSPWSKWATTVSGVNPNRTKNPDWWRSYNNVKHRRDTSFKEATLKNALNAMGALLIFCIHYYSRILGQGQTLPPLHLPLPLNQTIKLLTPESTLLRLDEQYYQ